jgi:hypothetical protein
MIDGIRAQLERVPIAAFVRSVTERRTRGCLHELRYTALSERQSQLSRARVRP